MNVVPGVKRVVVIGGGISGLAAAHRLLEQAAQRQSPIDVTLVEASDRVGGVIQTIQRDGYLIEAGPDNFVTSKPWALNLAKRLGLADQLLATNERFRRALVVRRGKLLPVPPGFLMMAPTRLWPVMTSPLFSPIGKLRMAVEPFVPARRDGSDESVASFVTRRFGRQLLDRLVQPLVGGIYTADPASLSLRATLPEFPEMEARFGSVWRGMQHRPRNHSPDSGARYSLFVTFRHGMQTLVDRLAQRIGPERLKLNTAVSHVARAPDGRTWLVTAQNGVAFAADAVIVAVPAWGAAKLLKPVDPQLADDLSRIEYASSAVVNLAYRRGDIGHRLDAFGVVVPATENRKILAASFSSVKYRGRAPEGQVLLRVFLGGATQPQILTRDNDGLIRTAQDDLRDLLSISAEPEMVTVHRWPASMPQYRVGHRQRVEKIANRLQAIANIELTGNVYAGVGIPDCIGQAERSADTLQSPPRQP